MLPFHSGMLYNIACEWLLAIQERCFIAGALDNCIVGIYTQTNCHKSSYTEKCGKISVVSLLQMTSVFCHYTKDIQNRHWFRYVLPKIVFQKIFCILNISVRSECVQNFTETLGVRMTRTCHLHRISDGVSRPGF